MIYDSNQIQTILPHRYPFLLVDRIESMSDNHIIGRKCISANEMQFLGHFPHHHVLPGVLIVEALAQTGAVLLLARPENKGKIAYFAGIEKMRFLKRVVPGDVLTLDVTFTKAKAGIYFADVKAFVDDVLVAKGSITSTLGDQA